MNYIIDNWYIIFALTLVTIFVLYLVVKFLNMPSSKQLNKVREWLLLAVTNAEKELGSGTGKLKLRYVYDMFLGKFPWIAKAITFEQFSYLVDDALDEMRELLATNKAVAQIVNNEIKKENENEQSV